MKKIPLFDSDALSEGSSKGMDVAVGGAVLPIFVMRRDEKIYAYLNRCPHTGGPLDWLPDQFLDPAGRFILCATHGAVFRIEDGLCIEGPCVKQHLQCLDTIVDRGIVNLLIQDNSPHSIL